MTVAETLAKFALSPLTEADDALAMMSLSFLDWAACGLAGQGEPVAQAVRGMVLDEAGRVEATLIGGGRVPARAAALANGAISHALDYDDTHFAHIGHPSVAVFPAALAMAERQGAGLGDMIAAALVGAEASIRFGIWLGRDHYQAGFHQTATAGAIGATVAVGRLAGLDHAQMTHALGLVATRASGLKSQFGTMGKPFNAGIAASNGVEAAELAARGFVSNPSALDGPQGFGPTHHGIGDIAAFDGLGRHWQMESISHKFHACCHGLHAMLEALGQINVDAAEVDAVTIRTHPRWDRVCNIPAPRTGLEAKFSYRLTAAMALSSRSTAALDSFSAETASDPALVALRDKVDVQFDNGLAETETHVMVRAGGSRHEASHDLAAPIPFAVRRAKLTAKASALIGADMAEKLQAALDQDGLSAFTSLLA